MYPNHADVPVDRGRVGAMGWMGSQMPAKITKPYVYRGAGEDTLTPDLPSGAEPKYLRPKPKPRKRRKPKPRREYDRWQSVRTVPLPDPEPWTDPVLDLPPPVRPARPAPGWRPTTGEDIDTMLDQIGVT